VSPLDALADGYLFSAHMIQHMLLLLVVPGLLLLALPVQIEDDRRVNRSTVVFANSITNAAVGIPGAWLAGVGAMWLWHVPALCNAATSIVAVRDIQIVSLLALGTLFWWPVLDPRQHQRLPPLAGIVYLFTACLGCTFLGIIITFAPVSVCPVYVNPVDWLGVLPVIRNGWGLTPSVDQQIGGLIMWVPACFVYLCGIMALLARWYSAAETTTQAPAAAAGQPVQT
jgi:putative membrane protein